MTDYAICAEHLSKKYFAVGPRQSYHTFRETLTSALGAPFRRFGNGHGGPVAKETLWALKDLSFQVKRGEVLGIIGRNGAGKSTLLKILSRVTVPTEGRVGVRGRVASLLEVGTGFHAELSGRENIFLNGAILGMSRKEVQLKFDDILSFAGVERFVDTPVKHYSSGMYMRLAFAVAAHLEADIVLVDEVLAVGDAEFQRKCLGKIDDVSRQEGRTAIFVSHNMSAINSLCSQALWLDGGRLQEVGETRSVVSRYLSQARAAVSGQKALTNGPNEKAFRFTGVSILNHERAVASQLEVTRPFYVSLEYVGNGRLSGVEMVLRVETNYGVPVFSTTRLTSDGGSQTFPGHGRHECYVRIPEMLLMPGSYFITITAHTPMIGVHDQHQQVIGFEIVDTGTDFAIHSNYKDIGIIIADLPWTATLDG